MIANTFRDTQSFEKIEKGQQVTIAVGSRGINQLSRIVLAVVNEIKNLGAVPVIVPAMGSHGGATAEGQRAVLEGFGITESAMGCSIVASMETLQRPRRVNNLEYISRSWR